MSASPSETCPVGTQNPTANPCRHKEDPSRWLSAKEETLFLNDGILWTVGLHSNPFDKKDDNYVGHSISIEFDMEGLLKIGTLDAEELQNRLFKLCRTSANQLRSYHAFQFRVLKGLWSWKYREGRIDDSTSQTFLAVNSSSSTAILSPKQRAQASTSNMSSRVSLLLMVPLLKSQASMVSSICRIHPFKLQDTQ